MSQATVLCHPHVAPLDRRLVRLAEFLGIECRLRVVNDAAAGPASELLERDHHCVMVSAATLGSLLAREADHGWFVRRLLDRARSLFVYGFRPAASDAASLRYLSAGLLEAVTPLPSKDDSYAIASDWRSLTREFTGLAFGPAQPAVDAVFSAPHASSALRPIICIAGSPSFVGLTRGRCTIFLLACRDVADPDVTVRGEFRVTDWFSRVIPAAMVLQHVFGRRTWHNPRPTASFIIDDPLLKERYGFLSYRQLLRATEDQPFAATIAFIPFNFRRNQASVVELFRARSDRLSLCIHGCNHTGGEFATNDLSALNAMSRLAADRMCAHQAATALPHGRIMVFPQGRFSPGSLKALRCNGYAAAVNTSPLPDGAGPAQHLSLREWLKVAITRYHGFPLFVRRYPRALADFAFDLFLGKPVLVVEHHTAFRHGYRSVADFIAALNALSPALRWASLEDTLGRATLQRQVSSETVEVQVWSNRSILQHDGDRPTRCLVVKDEAVDASVRSVTVDGRPVDYVLDPGVLKLSLDIEPGVSRVLEIGYTNDLPAGAHRIGLRTALAIHARRRLSELRDELLSTQQRLRTRAGLGRVTAAEGRR